MALKRASNLGGLSRATKYIFYCFHKVRLYEDRDRDKRLTFSPLWSVSCSFYNTLLFDINTQKITSIIS